MRIRFTLFILLGLGSQIAFSSVFQDSVGVVVQNGVTYVIHEVEQGETLYSLSKKYKVTIEEIKVNNEGLETLAIGQRLKIPRKTTVQSSTKPSATSAGTHVVAPKETLYAISKQYNVSLKQLRDWNQLEGNEISIGQMLIVVSPSGQTPPKSEVVQKKGNKHVVVAGETLYSISKLYAVSYEDITTWNGLTDANISIGQELIVSEPNANAVLVVAKQQDTMVVEVPVNKPIYQEPSSNGGNEKIEEKGIGGLMSGTDNTKKYLALHPTAPVGTIMQVINENNGLSVFVRVLGKLPNTGDNDKLLIRVSQKAYERLGVLDKNFRAKVVYSP